MRTISLTFIVCLSLFSCQKAEKTNPPNILIIVADDMGYSDLGCYGSEINTPNLDRLAENGIRFTQFYNSARCCPTRASILTGLYPHQAGIGRFSGMDRGTPGYRGSLGPNTVTLAEVLKPAGYRTFAAGKWHVNLPGPTDRGFEEFYGFEKNYGIDGWDPAEMQRYPEGRPVRNYEKGEFFATNVITDYALDFLGLARDTPEKPWLLYIGYQAAHFPLQAPLADIARYEDRYRVGWDSIRSERFERMKIMGVIESHDVLSKRSEIPNPGSASRKGVPGDGVHNPPWEILDEKRRTDLAKRMAVYAAMVDNMDQNIGRIITNLEKNHELDNTLILFLSDNGACAEWDPFGFDFPLSPDHGGWGTLGLRDVLHEGESLDRLGGPEGQLFSYGSGWANASNTPFTLYKHYVHEGGISSPLIIHWPDRFPDGGRIVKQYAHINDIMATCVDLSNAAYPEVFDGNEITPMEGLSLMKTLKGTGEQDRILTFEHEGHPGIRRGKWKLVSRDRALLTGEPDPEARFELYDIEEDRSETNDLSGQYPELVEELKTLMISEFNRTRVFPRPE